MNTTCNKSIYGAVVSVSGLAFYSYTKRITFTALITAIFQVSVILPNSSNDSITMDMPILEY